MRLLLIDGHYYLYRSFFAIRELTNSRGEPTNAIYGFCKAMRRMLVDVQPTHGATIWDRGLPERRVALQPEYKQNRPPMPDGMKPQEGWLMSKVPLFGLGSLSIPNTEADDLIAAYAKAAVKAGYEVVIATNDKDILQLVSPGISIYSTAKVDIGAGTFALLGVEQVRLKWGVDPAHIAEVLALTGDTSDNIPGVPGIGGKTAAQLVNAHGTVQAMLENLPAVKNDKIREKLSAAREQILANRQMVQLDDHLDLPVPLDSLKLAPRYDELIAALTECEFKSLLNEVKAEAAKTAPSEAAPPPPAKPASLEQGSLL